MTTKTTDRAANVKTAMDTAVENKPVYYWGTARVTQDKDGCALDFAAVRFERGKHGYATEADVTKGTRVPRCPSLSYATVRAVQAARARGEGVTSKLAADYPRALEAVRRDVAERAQAAAEAARAKADTAQALFNTALVDAAAEIAGIATF